MTPLDRVVGRMYRSELRAAVTARAILLWFGPMLIFAACLLAGFGNWLWAFFLLGLAIWIEVGL